MNTAFLHRLIVPLAAVAIFVLLDWRRTSAAHPMEFPGFSEPAQPATPVRIFRASCLKCHDSDGKGEIVRDVMPKVPDFTDAAWHASRSDADLGRSILEGKGKSMPPMRGKLGSVAVGQMVAFVRAFRGGKQVVEDGEEAPTAPAAQASAGPGSAAVEPSRPGPKDRSSRDGSRTFQRSCAACHGSDGRGVEMRETLASIPDFTVGTWQAKRTNPQLVVSVLDGKGTGMPAFRDKLTREQARDLIAFIRSFGPEPKRATRTTSASGDFDARFQQLLTEFEELRRKSQALSADPPPTRDGAPGSSPPPSPR